MLLWMVLFINNKKMSGTEVPKPSNLVQGEQLMSTKATIQAGDEVIFRSRYGAMPERRKVEKVTPKGWIRVGGTTYRPGWNGYETSKFQGECFLFSEAKWAELVEAAEQVEATNREKQKEREEHQRLYEQRKADDLAVVKEVIGLLKVVIKFERMLSDGERVVFMEIPVKEEYLERKGPEEILICKLKDVKDLDWHSGIKSNKVECHYTYQNRGTGGFPSCSRREYNSNEEALWDAIRCVYHSW